MIQASLVDTWAATAAGAYTLTENTLYTKEAFEDYYDHLTDRGMLTITRWVFDGLRLVSLAQAACESRGCSAADHIAHRATGSRGDVPLQEDAVHARRCRAAAGDRRTNWASTVLYAPGQTDGDATTTRSSCSRPTGRRSTSSIITTSRRRPTTARSSFTRRRSGISFRPRSGAACCSATASAR